MANCTELAPSRRRLFWTTQPVVQGDDAMCGVECASPRLACVEPGDPNSDCGAYPCPPATSDPSCPTSFMTETTQRTIATNDWVRGIIINMLMTDGRLPETNCGYRPGARGGHWSMSYIENGPSDMGTLMRTVESTGRTNDAMALVAAFAQATLDRLVTRGVADSVQVDYRYLGEGRMQLDVAVYGTKYGDGRVGLLSESTPNGWVWE